MGRCVCHRPIVMGAARARGFVRLILVVAASLLAACSSNGSTSPTTVSSPALTGAATSTLGTTSTTAGGTTTTSPVLTTATSALSTTTTSTTLAGATSTTDPDVRQVPPGDMPIVDAYKAYIGVFNQAAAANPVNASVDLGGVATAAFATTIRNYLASQRDKGAVLNTSLGVTLRPFVVADPRSATEVYVNDCQLDGSYWMDSAGNPLPGERAAVRRNGVLVKLVLRDGQWLVDAGVRTGGHA